MPPFWNHMPPPFICRGGTICRGQVDDIEVRTIHPAADFGFDYTAIFQISDIVADGPFGKARSPTDARNRWIACILFVSVIREAEQDQLFGRIAALKIKNVGEK